MTPGRIAIQTNTLSSSKYCIFCQCLKEYLILEVWCRAIWQKDIWVVLVCIWRIYDFVIYSLCSHVRVLPVNPGVPCHILSRYLCIKVEIIHSSNSICPHAFVRYSSQYPDTGNLKYQSCLWAVAPSYILLATSYVPWKKCMGMFSMFNCTL